jgi:hypothetical protein
MYYPERIISTIDEIESTIETKPTKITSSVAKKVVVTTEIDKTSILFDEKMKELFHKRYSTKLPSNFLFTFSSRQSDASERRERLRTRWNEIKLHFNPVYEQET